VSLALHQSGPDNRARLTTLIERLDEEASFDESLRMLDRRAVHAPVTLGVMAGGYKALYRGWATDLSASGIGLLIEHDFPMGAVLYVSLDAIAGEPLLLPIRICYVRRLLKHTHRVGGTFEIPDDEGEQVKRPA